MIRTVPKAKALGIAGFILLAFSYPAQALPTFGGGGRANCMGCHGTPREAAMGPGTVSAAPGDLVQLGVEVTDGDFAYSMSLAGLDDAGLAGFTPDAAWADHFTAGNFNSDPQYGGPFYALSDTGVSWTGPGPVMHAFDLQLADTTSQGTYDLTFTVAGSGNEGLWRDEEAFQLVVIPEPSAAAMASLGILGLSACWWRRRRRGLRQ